MVGFVTKKARLKKEERTLMTIVIVLFTVVYQQKNIHMRYVGNFDEGIKTAAGENNKIIGGKQ